MGRRNLERLREWIGVCRLPHPSFWYGAFGLMWLCVGHSPRLLSFICLPRFSPCLTLLPLAVSPVSLIWFGFLMWSRVGRFSRMVSITIKRFTPQLGWKRKKKKSCSMGAFFWWGGGRHISASTRPPKKKKSWKRKKKSLAAEMFLICCACFSLTRFVVEDCRRFWCSKKSVN